MHSRLIRKIYSIICAHVKIHGAVGPHIESLGVNTPRIITPTSHDIIKTHEYLVLLPYSLKGVQKLNSLSWVYTLLMGATPHHEVWLALTPLQMPFPCAINLSLFAILSFLACSAFVLFVLREL
jgi:hypothetical protein